MYKLCSNKFTQLLFSPEKQEEKDKTVQGMMGVQQEANECKEKVDLKKTELEIFESNHKQALDAVRECEHKEKEHAEDLEWGRKRVEEINGRMGELMGVKEKQKEVEGLVRRKNEIKQEMAKVRSNLQEIRHNRQSNQSRGRVHSYISQLKSNDEIRGIHGRLGDLGGIDPKYDAAISSCCSALDHYVVHDTETAKKCIRALARDNVGRATFIAMDKMRNYERGLNNRPDPNEVGGLPRLVDLVKPRKEMFSLAFYFALRDTLVADNLNVAKKVAYGARKRWRVVTLDGSLIDNSGTMSGGGTVARGRMGATCKQDSEVSDKELREKEMGYEQLEAEMKEVNEKVSQLEKEIRSELTEMRKLQQELVKGLKCIIYTIFYKILIKMLA